MSTAERIEAARVAGSASTANDAAPALMARLQRGFAEALARRPGALREADYLFAGRPVRLRVVGARLAERTHRAFTHLRRPGAAAGVPALHIDVWDEAETGVAGGIDAEADTPDRRWLACDGTLIASPDGRFVGFLYSESVSVLDRRAQRLVSCRRDGSQLFTGDASKPFILMLSIWCHDRGVQVVHAALVSRAGAGVLIPGVSGTGKSTTALAAAAQGLEFLGDDFVGLERTCDDDFLGHSIYDTACLARDSLFRFDGIRRYAVEDRFARDEKPILFLSEVFPERLRATVPVRALALVRIRQERTEVRRAGRGEALRELAASTLHTGVPRPGREALELFARLVERVPAYRLQLGPELEDIGRGLEAIISEAGSADDA